MSKFLAFDFGASSGRGIIGTLENGKLSLQEIHRFPNGPVEENGHFYWDYDRLSAEIITGLGKALEIEPELDGIGIDTWGVDYLLFDRTDGRIVCRPFCYRDERTVEAAKILGCVPMTELYAASGIYPNSFNTIFQLLAHQREYPEDLKNSVFLPIPDAFAAMLGGDFTAEYTHCSTTGLLDPYTRDWCWELIDRVGLPRKIFPKVVPSCTPGGMLKEEICRKLNCKPIRIFKIASHDTGSAFMSVPAPAGQDFACISAGTWALFGTETDTPCISDETLKNGFTNEGGVCNTIRFLTNIMGSWLFQETRRVWNENGRDLSFSDMEKMALSATPCKYLINPNDSRYFTPGDMPGRIAEFCRESGQGEPDDAGIVRAIYDSLAMYFNNKLGLISSITGKKYTVFNIVGGGTKDRLLMQLTADAMNIPVIAGPVEATAAGNILGQALASGNIASLAEAREVIRNSFDVITYTPDAASHELFCRTAERFAEILK